MRRSDVGRQLGIRLGAEGATVAEELDAAPAVDRLLKKFKIRKDDKNHKDKQVTVTVIVTVSIIQTNTNKHKNKRQEINNRNNLPQRGASGQRQKQTTCRNGYTRTASDVHGPS